MSQTEKTFNITESDYPAIVERLLHMIQELGGLKTELEITQEDADYDIDQILKDLNRILYGSDVKRCPAK